MIVSSVVYLVTQEEKVQKTGQTEENLEVNIFLDLFEDKKQ